MECSFCCFISFPVSKYHKATRFSLAIVSSSKRDKHQLPKNLRYRRRTPPPPDFYPVIHRVQERKLPPPDPDYEEFDGSNIVWGSEEIEAISSLFQGRIPQKPGNSNRERPLPLTLPHKTRLMGLPTPKNLNRRLRQRQPISNQIYKNPAFLISLARDIRSLAPDEDVSTILNQWAHFLRKGSLSLTVRELGHMNLPTRALHVFNWIEKQPHLFPDDRTLASTVEVLARAHKLKTSFDFDNFIRLSSQSVYEAMVKGLIKGGYTRLASKLLSAATKGKRTLGAEVYAKLILQLGKNADTQMLAVPLLADLSKRDDLKLSQQDCTAIMKVCIRLGKFDIVEALYDWFKKSGAIPSVVMFTTLIHSRYTEKKYREAMAVVWEMEDSNCMLDLPAYRVLIKLFAALKDLSRMSRYYSKLKESGFCFTYDIYREMIEAFMVSGRRAKCEEICRDAEMAGFKLDERTRTEMLKF